MKQESDYDFTAAPLFRKVGTLHESDLEFVTVPKEVVTVVNGIIETKKMAKPGDVIVTGVAGERFVSSLKTFNLMHQRSTDDPSLYVMQHKVRAIPLTEDTHILASWGEDQFIKAGGVVVLRLNDNRFYGNQAETFEATYSRADESGAVFCAQTIPLSDQLAAARAAKALLHENDILTRMRLAPPPRPNAVRVRRLRQEPKA